MPARAGAGKRLQPLHLTSSPPQVLAERNKEGLEERSWAEALAPRVIFNVICSKMRVDYITRESLRNFYENFSGLEGDTLEKVATEGYRSMSANGDYELD